MNDKSLTKSYRATKLALLCYAWRCLSRLQEIQSWETLFQKPSKAHKYQYTHTHTVFVFFIFFPLFHWKKINTQTNILKKTRVTQKTSTKHTRDARTKMESLEGVFFLPNRRLGGRWIIPILRPLMRRIWRRIKPIEVCQEHHSL